MKEIPTTVHGCVVIMADRHHDGRGFFQELYKGNAYWQQVNWSRSGEHVLRGLHVAPYEKLVTCVSGRIFDVVADMRPDSRTYKKWFGTILDGANPTQLFVPSGCAHGFLSLESDSSVVYLQSGRYQPENEWSVAYNDPTLAISWPVLESEIVLSLKDSEAKKL